MDPVLSKLPGAILPWYQLHKRPLPWRQDREPYHIWLSEIMLQQTRVEAVKGYYTRFLEALPTIETLANCPEDRLLKLWEGLGYYSRVRNLQKAAKILMDTRGGRFPSDHREILALPGIGDYTAGAICSIAFEQPTPAIDGNVLRVLSRLTDDPTPIDLPSCKDNARQQLAQVYPAQAGDFTQALMELGATLCGPNRAPDCNCCPCRDFCLGHLRGTAPSLPVKRPKKARRVQEKTLFLFCCDGRYALKKRPAGGLLGGMWQFPDVDGLLDPEQAVAAAGNMGVPVRELRRQSEKIHIFTHIQWNMRCYFMDTLTGGDFTWLTAEQIEKTAALPTAYRQFWEDKL